MNFESKIVVRLTSALELAKLAEALAYNSGPQIGAPMTPEREQHAAAVLYGRNPTGVLADTHVLTMKAERDGAFAARDQANENMNRAISNMADIERELDEAKIEISTLRRENAMLRGKGTKKRKGARR